MYIKKQHYIFDCSFKEEALLCLIDDRFLINALHEDACIYDRFLRQCRVIIIHNVKYFPIK